MVLKSRGQVKTQFYLLSLHGIFLCTFLLLSTWTDLLSRNCNPRLETSNYKKIDGVSTKLPFLTSCVLLIYFSGRVAEKEVPGYVLAVASVILKQQLILGDSSRQVSSQTIRLQWKRDN